MKVFALLIVLVVFKYSCGDANLLFAFENVTRHLFELETRMFIDNYGVDLNELTLLLLKGLNERAMPFQLSNKVLENEVQMDSSALVAFNSFGQLRKFNDKLGMTNKYYKPLQLFLFCHNASVKDIKSLSVDVSRRHKNSKRPFEIIVEKSVVGSEILPGITRMVDENTALTDVINYEYFLVEEGQFVKLLTFVWYSPGKCGKLQLIEVNKFNAKTSKWENPKFFKEKLSNFHGCEIFEALSVYTYDASFYITMPHEFATNLNYKPRSHSETRSHGTAEVKGKVDLYLHKACYDAHDYMSNFDNLVDPKANPKIKKNRTKIACFIAFPVQYSQTWLAVPPSGNYSEYEKLAMPFDVYTWILIASTFVAAFVTILILYCVPRTTRDLVIGPNITTPSLNILQIFFGIALNILPNRNFPRFLTMLFILYCLIIRTAWQGKMFEFMTKDVPKPEVQTAEEMIQDGYDFYLELNFKEKYPDSEIAKSGKIKSSDETFNLTFKNWKSIFDPSFKGVLQVNNIVADQLIQNTQGRFSKRLRGQTFSSKMCGMAFMSHHHFTGIFDLKSQQMFTAGIVNFFNKENHDPQAQLVHDRIKYKIPPDEPQVLNLKKLEPGFVIFSSCLLFTIFVFLIELLSKLCRYLLPTFKSKREFGVAHLALNAAKIAISVVPELDDVAIDDKQYIVLNWEDKQATNDAKVVKEGKDDAEMANAVEIECADNIVIKHKAEIAKVNPDIQENNISVETIDQKGSIDDLIKTFEIEAETAKQTRVVVENRVKSRRDSIADLLEGIEIQPDSIEQSKVIADNQADSIDEVIDNLFESFESNALSI